MLLLTSVVGLNVKFMDVESHKLNWGVHVSMSLEGRGKTGWTIEIDCCNKPVDCVKELVTMCRDEEIHKDEFHLLLPEKSPMFWRRTSMEKLYARRNGMR